MHPRITVIGCGLSGMITALSFAARGINSTIIERQHIRPLSKLATARQVQEAYGAQNRSVLNVREDSSTGATQQLPKEVEFPKGSIFNDIRTTALTDSSKVFFEKLGIWEKIASISGPINDIYVADNKAPEMVHFASNELQVGQIMGYLVENKNFKKLLLTEVLTNKHITIIDNSSYEVKENNDNKCILTLNGNRPLIPNPRLNETNEFQGELAQPMFIGEHKGDPQNSLCHLKMGFGSVHECDLLVVCDGGNSQTRQKYFSCETNKPYTQYALTFIVQHEKPHEGTAVEHFMPTGPFAILPLKDQNFSSVVWTIKSEMKDAVLNLPKDEFLHMVQQNFGQFLGNINIKSEIASFPLRAYSTNKYYNKRIVLVADSAHVIHPLAGQGLNQGIKDIESLANNILEFGANTHSLETYQNMRKNDNNAMLEITDTLNTIFSNNSRILHTVRQFGFKATEKVSPFKKLLIKYAMGRRK